MVCTEPSSAWWTNQEERSELVLDFEGGVWSRITECSGIVVQMSSSYLFQKCVAENAHSMHSSFSSVTQFKLATLTGTDGCSEGTPLVVRAVPLHSHGPPVPVVLTNKRMIKEHAPSHQPTRCF